MPILRQLLPTAEQQANSQNRIRLITIFFGANDAALPFAYQHVPITRYMNNLSQMIDMIQNANSKYYNPNCKILLITQPPVNEVQWRKRCDENGEKMNRTAEVAKSYAEAAKQIASQYNVPVVDLWSELMVAAEKSNLSNFLLDGLHLNTNGNRVGITDRFDAQLSIVTNVSIIGIGQGFIEGNHGKFPGSRSPNHHFEAS